MERFLQRWKQYRYRFVPWIALNLKDRSVRSVPKGNVDKLASDGDVLLALTKLLSAFHQGNNISGDNTSHRMPHNTQKSSSQNLTLMKDVMGFTVERRSSTIAGGGRGVKVTDGCVPKGAVTSLYPGLVYEQYEPIFFQSLGNPFVFRCIDRVLIDGNDKGISKFLYRSLYNLKNLNQGRRNYLLFKQEIDMALLAIDVSCHGRDRVGPYTVCDESWLTDWPVNPLAVGQYVNNHTKENPANVAYQEFDVPADFPFHLRQYLPNIFYSSSLETAGQQQRLTRLVVLVATRDIQCGEELFSSYFTVVH